MAQDDQKPKTGDAFAPDPKESGAVDPSKTRVSPLPQGEAPSTPTIPMTIPELDKERPKRKSNQASIWIAVVAALGILIILGLVLSKSPSVPTPKPSVSEAATQEEATEEAATPSAQPDVSWLKPKKVENWQYREISDEACWGSAPLAGAGAKPVFSPEADADIAAIAEALKYRAEIVFGTTSARWKNGMRSTIAGTWQGFVIRYQLTTLPGQEPSHDLLVTTPSRAVLHFVDRVLQSAKGTDPEKLAGELAAAGLKVVKNPGGEKVGEAVVRLERTVYPPVPPEYLIQSDSVGPVKIGDPIRILDSAFPKGYVVAQKKVLIGARYFYFYKIHDEQQNALMFVYENEGKVMGINPISERYRTERSLGIGSTLAEMLMSHTRVRFGFLPGERPVAKVEPLNVKFFLDEKMVDFGRNLFLPEAKVDSILVGEAPKEEES